MDSTSATLVAALGGTTIGSVVGVVATLIQTRASRRVTAMQIDAQLETIKVQRDSQISVESAGRARERREESYRHLMLWLDDIQAAMERVHAAVYSRNQSDLVAALKIADEWPFETLRPPKYTAETRYLWSSSVEAARRRAFAASSEWHGDAQQAIGQQMSARTRRRSMGIERSRHWRSPQQHVAPLDARQSMWLNQGEVTALLGEVRDQVREEMA